jgi:hypothetical protein
LLRIVTPPEQWADAVEFPPQDSVAVLEAPKVLKWHIHVLEGKIGIGVLTPNNVHNREIRVGPSVEAELVAIPLSSGTQLGSLMVRNLSRSGRSKADIQFLACETSVLEDISKHDHEIAIDPKIFASFKPWCGFVPAGFFADWSGILTSVDVWDFKVDELAIFNRVRHENHSVPIELEHGLDWAALAQAVGDSGATFRMAALGAGWGRWLAAGAALAAQTGRDYRLLEVEAEPQHFEWMLRHFKQNNISEDRYIALNAAAVGKPGECWFAVGNSQAWYGQSIIDEDDTPKEQSCSAPEG